MSTTDEQTTPAVTPATGEDAETTTEVLDALSDVRVEDVGGFTTALQHLIDVGKALVQRFQGYESATDKVAAARMAIREYMILPNGLPDWAGTSQGYKAAVETAEYKVYVARGPEAKRKLDQNVRKAVERKFRLPQIVGWILAHENGFGDELTAWQANPDNVIGNPSDKLKERVQFHFANSFAKKDTPLQIPETFPQFRPTLATSPPPSPGPGQGDPANPLATFDGAMGGLKQIRPDFAMSAVLHGFSDLSQRLIDAKGEVRGREQIEDFCDRIEGIAMLTAKHLRGESTPDEIRKLDSLYWSKTDTPKND